MSRLVALAALAWLAPLGVLVLVLWLGLLAAALVLALLSWWVGRKR